MSDDLNMPASGVAAHPMLALLAGPGPVAGSAARNTHAAVAWPLAAEAAKLDGDTASVAIGPDDTVWVFHRGESPVAQYDLDGRLLRSWGRDQFVRPHGISVDRFGDLYLVDEFNHVVEKRSPDGGLLMTLGSRGRPAAAHSGGAFNRPTSVAVHPRNGDIYVADGYANSSVHHFDRRGRHLKSWGRPGGQLGCFSLPHHIQFLDDDVLVVSDRENFRLQFFTSEGAGLGQWHAHRPCAAIPMSFDGESLLLIAELGASGIQRGVEQLGNRLVAVDSRGRERLVLDNHVGGERLVAPHDVAVDSAGRIFVAEVAVSWLNYNFDITPLSTPTSLRRWDPIG
jgi:DNA-binding beta-propeller fold protein YncE